MHTTYNLLRPAPRTQVGSCLPHQGHWEENLSGRCLLSITHSLQLGGPRRRRDIQPLPHQRRKPRPVGQSGPMGAPVPVDEADGPSCSP